MADAKPIVGTIPGTFIVTNGGSSSYVVPIRVAPGTAGTDPKLSLIYASEIPGGPLGPGWSLSGLSTITRGSKSLYEDGIVQGVKLDDSDALYLDGQRLIAVATSGTGPGRVTEFRKKDDDLTRVREMGSSLSSAKFVVSTKGGVTQTFDGSNNSNIRLSDGTILLFAVSRTSDSSGNYTDYSYVQNGSGDYDISRIAYTGHVGGQEPFAAIEFTHDSAPTSRISYLAGQAIRKDIRLTSILAKAADRPENVSGAVWTTVATYNLDYDVNGATGDFTLSRVREVLGDSGEELEPTKLTYSAPVVGWSTAGYTLPPVIAAAPTSLGEGYRYAHVDVAGGVLPDILFAEIVQGRLESWALKNNGGTWKNLDELAPPFAFANDEGADLGVLVIDLNGDGRADLLQSYAQDGQHDQKAAYLASAHGWSPTAGFLLPFTLSRNGKASARTLTAKWSGGSGADLIYDDGISRGFLANKPSGWKLDASHQPPLPIDDRTQLIDVDADGIPELVYASANAAGSVSWRVFRYTAAKWEEINDPAFFPPVPASLPKAAILLIDLNSDGHPDIIVSSAKDGIKGAFLSSPTGWKPAAPGKLPSFDLVDASGVSSGARIADLDGDGVPDVVAYRKSSAGEVRFAYLQTGSGWVTSPTLEPPSPISQGDAAAPVAGVFLGDLDGDGRADLALPGRDKNSFGEVYQGGTGGFIRNYGYVPPVAFSRKDQQDQGLRIVDLNGDGLPDLLYSRETIKDGKVTSDSGAYINTGNGWTAAAGLIPPKAFASDAITGNPVQFADVDDDGYIDMLYNYRHSDGTVDAIYYHNEPDGSGGRKWVAKPSSDGFTPPQLFPFAAQGVGDLGVRVADLNGDGRPDIIVGTLGPKTGNPANDAPQTCSGAVCKTNRSRFSGTAWLNDGTKWIPTPAYAPPLPLVAMPSEPNRPSEDLSVQLVDVDGDGLPDLVAWFHHPDDKTIEVRETWRNTGIGWINNPSRLSPTPLDQAQTNPRAALQWIDVNGDGLQDLVLSQRNGATDNSRTWLSTGNGFTESGSWKVPIQAIVDHDGDPGFRLIDVNGDGLVDLVYAFADDQGEHRGLYTNSGAGWVTRDSSLITQLPTFLDKDHVDQGVRLVDVDGNGLPDLVQSFDSDNTGQSLVDRILLNTGRRSAVLSKIETGYGASISIYYASLMERPPSGGGAPLWRSVYESGVPQGYPLIAPVPPSYVVDRYVVDDGTGRRTAFDYRYGGYRIDAQAMRSVGFRWRESMNERTGALTHTEFDQNLLRSGYVTREATCLLNLAARPAGAAPLENYCPSGSPPPGVTRLAETTNDWTTRQDAVPGAAGAGIRQTTLASNTSRVFELDGKTVSEETTSFTYDEPTTVLDRHENLLKSVSSRMDGTALEVVNEFQDDVSGWFLGRLVQATTHKVGDPAATPGGVRHVEDRVSVFTYDNSNGLLASETIQPGDPLSVTTQYTRDQFGNISETRVIASGEQPRGSDITYDATGRFPIKRTDIQGRATTQTVRVSDGKVLSITDASNLTTRYAYDGAARLIAETSPTGVVSKTEFLAPAQLSDQAALQGLKTAYVVRSTRGNLTPTLSIYDGQGRLLRTVVDGFTSDDTAYRPIQKDALYDEDGRPNATSAPYERGSVAKFASIRYDALGRMVQEKAINGATTSIQYAGRVGGGQIVTTTDPMGRKTVEETNTRGLQMKVTDPNGQIIVFADYDAADHLNLLRLPNGTSVRHAYDGFGRLRSLIDPDLGQRQYSYNAFGELQTETDGLGHTLSVSYDTLGRMSQKIINGTTYSYKYVSTGYGLGQLKSITDGLKYKKTLTYDQFGRAVSGTVSIGSENFTTTIHLDTYGRVLSTDYPTTLGTAPIQVFNHYDHKGFMFRVTDASGAKAYWQSTATTAAGQVSSDLLGNNLVETQQFDSATQAMIAKQVGTLAPGAAGSILNLKLTYNTSGDLLRRQETVLGVDEQFQYDELDRLTGMTSSAVGPETYKFDALGRMTFKTGQGAYSYKSSGMPGNWQPANAPVSVGVGKTQQSLQYDLNGNLTKAGGRTLTYTDDNELARVESDPSHFTEFNYDPSGARYRQHQVAGGVQTETMYVGGYERTTSINPAKGNIKLVRHRYFLTNGSGVFASIDLLERDNAAGVPIGPIQTRVWYLHSDQLGSVVRITDDSGNVAGQYWYDPWGKQVIKHELLPANDLGPEWRRGFEGKEYLEGLSLIHMEARVYDPSIGLFTSPDPVGEPFTKTQSFNRYAFALDNPLKYTDPSGLFHIGGFFGDVIHAVGSGVQAIGGAIGDAAHWVGQNWKEVVVVAVAVAVTVVTGGSGAPIGAAILSGMAGGAAAGFVSSALNGGSFADDLQSAAIGAIWGGITAGAFSGAGAAESLGGFESSAGSVALHGAVGGGLAVAQGGDFWNGASAAALGEAASVYLPSFGSTEADMARAALVGGTASQLTGGNFANGAVTAATAYLFNDLGSHGDLVSALKGQEISDKAADWEGTPYSTGGETSGAEGGADCSHSTYVILNACGVSYKYTDTANFADAAANDNSFPFHRLGDNEAHQPGDVILFKGHMAIYSGQEKGQDMMWTAHFPNGHAYNEMAVKYWPSKPIGWYRSQTPRAAGAGGK